MSPLSNDKCPYKSQRKKRHRNAQRRPVKTKTRIGVTQPPARELLEPPEAGRGEEGFSPRAFEGGAALANTLILDFGHSQL